MEAKRRGGRDGIRDSDRYSSLNRERDRDGDCIRDKERNEGLKSSSRCQQFETPSFRPGSAMGMFSEPLSHSSPSSQGSGDHTQNPTVVLLHRNLDKEPGELSSGSKSDDGNGRHGSSSPVRKRKRKYSPIVWDLDDKEACQKSSKASESSKLGSRQMFRDSTSAKPCLRSPSPQPPLAPEPSSPARIIPFESAEREVQATKTMSPMQEDIEELGQLDTFQRLGEEEVDDPTVPVTLAASRWSVAEEVAHSPSPVKLPPMPQHCVSMDSRDIATPSDDESQDVSMQSASTSPEPGEFVEVKDASGSDASGVKPDDNDIREDEQYEQDLNKRELMDLEENDEEEQPELNLECEEGPCTPPQAQQRSIDMLKGCRSVDEYERLNKIDEGTYGVVYRARNKKTGEIVALKKVKMEKEREGFPMTSLREINVLLSFHHPSVVDVKEVVVGSSLDSIFMVMEYMEHDLKGLMESMKHPFSQSEVKCLMLQLFEGVKYLHDNWVLHRDLKTSNLLLNNRGELKICDFGLARQYGSPLKTYSRTVVTLWYRAPELLLGARKYSTAIDMWSLGCIMAEFLSKEPLFNGKSEIEQIDKIFRTLGTPNEKIWPDYVNLPGVKINFVRQPYNRLREKFPPTSFSGRPTLSESGFDLLNRLLTYDPLKRITVEEALKHDWFLEVPLPKMKELMPTFPVRSEHDRRLRRLMKSPDPLEEQRKRELCQGSEVGTGGLFG